jgi:diguanylate cyclase (GGDEF)-like protein
MDHRTERPRLGPETRIRLLIVALALLGTTFAWADHALLTRTATPAGGLGAMVLLAVCFGIAERCVVHLELGENAHSFTLVEIPMVVGLFTVGSGNLVIARVVGGLAVLTWQFRRSPTKLGFNAALFLTEASTYLFVFHAVSNGHLSGPWAWCAAVSAGQVMNVIGATAVWLAIASTGGEPDPFRRVITLGAASSAAAVSLGLLGVLLAQDEPGALWMVGIVGAVLFAAYRQFGRLQAQYASLRQVHEFTKILATSPELSTTVRDALHQARTVLQASHAEMCLVGGSGQWTDIRVSYDGTDFRTDHLDGLGNQDPLLEHLRATGTALVIGRAAPRAADLDSIRSTRRVRDLMACPLQSMDELIGTFAVFDHLGDVSTFDDDDLRVFETLANHVAISLQRARLVDELRVEVVEKEYQALHDALTGLGNRAMFEQAVEVALRSSRTTGTCTAVLVMDLNRFKDINDTLGHHTGDQMLRELAERITEVLPVGATATRLGGDEFGIVLPSIASGEAATRFGDLLLGALKAPFAIGGLHLGIGGAIGISLAPEHGTTSGTLLQHADIAMYAAKENAEGLPVTYSPDLASATQWRLSLAGALRAALAEHELEVHYQPLADFATGEVVGAEALLRWEHPEHGWIPPEDVVALAEHLGLIRQLTLWVLETALVQCRAWRDAGFDLQVSVNLTAQSMVDSNFVDQVSYLLASTGNQPANLCLEITETQVIRDAEQTLAVLTRLRSAGIALAVDDFGTGFSSLSYLTHLPISAVKIDKTFVQKMLSDDTAHKVVQAIIDLGRNLDKKIVAEGVEDLVTWDALADLGCDIGQGYYLSRPLPSHALAAWLPRRARHAASAAGDASEVPRHNALAHPG